MNWRDIPSKDLLSIGTGKVGKHVVFFNLFASSHPTNFDQELYHRISTIALKREYLPSQYLRTNCLCAGIFSYFPFFTIQNEADPLQRLTKSTAVFFIWSIFLSSRVISTYATWFRNSRKWDRVSYQITGNVIFLLLTQGSELLGNKLSCNHFFSPHFLLNFFRFIDDGCCRSDIDMIFIKL